MADDWDEETNYDFYQNAQISGSVESPMEMGSDSNSHITPSESITSLQFMLSTIQQERTRDVGQKLVTEGVCV